MTKNENQTKKPPKKPSVGSAHSVKPSTPSNTPTPRRAAGGGKNEKPRSGDDAVGQMTVAEGNRKFYLHALKDALDGLELHSAAFDTRLKSVGTAGIGAAGLGEADVHTTSEIFDLATRLLALIGKNLEARPVRALGIPLAATSELVDKATAVQDSVCDATKRFFADVELEVK